MKYILGLVVAFFLLGCGGGGGSSSSSALAVELSSLETALSKGNPVSFSSSVTNSGDGEITYLWDFGDGTSSTEANPTHTYAAKGEYSVNLTVSSGEKSAVTSQTVIIYEALFSTTQKSAFQLAVDTSFNAQKESAGISVAVYKDGYPSWEYVAGKSSETALMAVDTPSVIYSISKSITASMVMKLVEEGKLSLTNRLSEVLGSSINSLNSNTINKSATIEQLLNHTSGIRDTISTPAWTSYVTSLAMGSVTWNPITVLNLLEESYSNVGTHFYANSNYVLLGLVIENISGGTLEEYLNTNLYQKLSISGKLLPKEKTLSNVAQPYDDLGSLGGTSGVFGNLLATQPFFFDGMGALVWSAGAMTMTAKDLAKFGYAFLGSNGSLLSSSTQSTVLNSVSTTSENYGYGISSIDFTLKEESKKLYGHNGNGNGYATALYHNRDLDMTVVVLTNSNNLTNNTAIDTFTRDELNNIVSEILNAY